MDDVWNDLIIVRTYTFMRMPRMAFRNAAAWPEVDASEAFPGETQATAFSTKKFYTAHAKMILIPSATMTVTDPPEPDAELTRVAQVPVVRVSVIKYASLVRGDRSCQRHGSQFQHWENMFHFLTFIVYVSVVKSIYKQIVYMSAVFLSNIWNL